MKVSTFVTQLNPGESRLRVPASVLEAISTRGRDRLYGVLVPCHPSDSSADPQDPPTPFATVYASPLPYRAWSRLLRASFTTGPGPGQAARLCRHLEAIDLYARAVETGETWPLDGDTTRLGTIDIIGNDTSIVFEIPCAEFIEDEPKIRKENRDLYQSLRLLTEKPTSDTAHRCLELLSERLKTLASKSKGRVPRVDSVLPMLVLNRLGRTQTGGQVPPHHVFVEEIPGKSLMWISCEEWGPILWPRSREVVEEARHPQDKPVVAVVSVDTDEKLLAFHFYRPHDKVIAQFQLIVPSAGVEHRWWQWVYEEIAQCQGTVIGSRSSARADGRWGSLTLVAAFPGLRKELDEGLSNDITHVVNCFRRLKGAAAEHLQGSKSDAFRALADDLQTSRQNASGMARRRAANHCLGTDDAERQLQRKARTDSTLRDVRLWYAHTAPSTGGYERRFGRNPFSFTRPLNLQECVQLYDYEHTYEQLSFIDSRARLARRLIHHLAGSAPENVVLVGAYRSGKTTLMNMVVDSLNGVQTGVPQLDQQLSEIEPVIGVRISAAVTPPELLFLAVFSEICKLVNAKNIGSTTQALARRVQTAAIRLAKGNIPLSASLEPQFIGPLLTSIKLAVGKTATSNGGHMDLTTNDDHMKRLLLPGQTGRRAGLLRTSVGLLRALLDEASRAARDDHPSTVASSDFQPKEAAARTRIRGSGLRVVVALDEVTASKDWGGKWAFPAWRELIEDPDFRQARWLFSSTIPLSASVDYSPLGNAMREYNLGPLETAEVTEIIKRFESPGEWDGTVDVAHRVRPTVTYASQRLIGQLTGRQPYLLQVVCCHLFEECIREEIPIITGRMVKKIVRRRVLPELGDYFQGQWKYLVSAEGDAIRTAILAAIRDWNDDFWEPDEIDRVDKVEFTPEVRKALERAGLGGEKTEAGLVPLFVMWVREHFELARTTT